MTSQNWATLAIWCGSIAGILVVIAGIAKYKESQAKDEEKIEATKKDSVRVEAERKKNATTGVIGTEKKSSEQKVKIWFGEGPRYGGVFLEEVAQDSLEDGISIFKFPQDNTLQYPIRIKIDKGKLLVSWTLYDLHNKVLVTITDNEWEVNKSSGFRRNYDSSGFELIDEYDVTKLQVQIVDNRNIQLKGFVRVGDSFIYAYPPVREPTQGPNVYSQQVGFVRRLPPVMDQQSLQKLRSISSGVKPMFKYPSDLHLHERTVVDTARRRDGSNAMKKKKKRRK